MKDLYSPTIIFVWSTNIQIVLIGQVSIRKVGEINF